MLRSGCDDIGTVGKLSSRVKQGIGLLCLLALTFFLMINGLLRIWRLDDDDHDDDDDVDDDDDDRSSS